MLDHMTFASIFTTGTIFEMTMLVCFGASWPFSIYRVWRAKQCIGKSMVFVTLVLIGYVSGVIFRTAFQPHYVAVLYGLNGVMVSLDLSLSLKYHRAHRRREHALAASRP